MDRLIAPIFNITKRPRQALVSDPFDSQSTALSISNGPTATHTGPMHRAQPGSWNQGRTNPSMMTALLPPKPSLPQYQSKKMAKAGSNLHVTQNQSYSKAAPPTRKVTVTGGQIRALSAGQANFQSSNMNNTRQGTSQPQASSFQGFQGNKTSSFNQKRQYQQPGQDWPNRTTSHTAQMGLSTMSSVNQLSHVSQVSSARSSFPSQQKFSTQAFNKSQIQSQSQNSNITRCSSPQPSTSYATSLTSKQKAYHNNKQDIDKSLRVLTGTALSIKQWGNSPHSVPVMFEIHGTLNAAVTANAVMQGKEFLLRDETGSIPCVFFEIDRRLPLMIRGHWYRCMGTFDRKLGMFKCVSVRGSNLPERNLAKLMLPLSEETMKALVRDLRET